MDETFTLGVLTDDAPASIRAARIAEASVSVSQRLIIHEIIERLQDLYSLDVVEIYANWYKIECRGMKVQIEIRNPDGYIDIMKLPFADGSLSFPHPAWDRESIPLQLGNEDLIVSTILSNFAIVRSED